MGNVTVKLPPPAGPAAGGGGGGGGSSAASKSAPSTGTLERLWRVNLKVHIPSEEAGLIIGSHGAGLKQMADETHAHVSVVGGRDAAWLPGPNSADSRAHWRSALFTAAEEARGVGTLE